MSKKRSFLAIGLVAAGLLLIMVSFIACGCSFKNIEGGDGEMNTYEVEEKFSGIYVDIETADLTFIPTNDGSTRVACENEKRKLSHTAEVNDGKLEIKLNDERKWYDHLMFSFKSPKIYVYLPEGEYTSLFIKAATGDIEIPADFKFDTIDLSLSTGDVECRASANDFIKIKASTGDVELSGVMAKNIDVSLSTGDIELENCKAESISLETTTGYIEASGLQVDSAFSTEVSTGKTELSDVNCKTYTSEGSTGRITLTRFVCEGLMSIERDTGDVTLYDSDAGEILIETDTGDVSLELRSEKVFITSTDTGRIRVPESTSGGKCKVTTDTGDISATYK